MKTNNIHSRPDVFGRYVLALGIILAICAIACQIVVQHTDLYADPGQYILAELGAGLLGIASAFAALTIIVNEVMFRWDLLQDRRKAQSEHGAMR